MKKILMSLAVMAVTMGLQAQTKLHDVACSNDDDAKGSSEVYYYQ